MEVVSNEDGKLTKFLLHNVQGMSFSSIQKLLRKGDVKVNNVRTKENINVHKGDKIEIYSFVKSIPNIDVVYKDKNILIVNKPSGIECAIRDKTNDSTYTLEEIFKAENAICIHRLDRLTEGLVILARNKDTAKSFETFFRNRNIIKKYKALVLGEPKEQGVKTAYLRKKPSSNEVEISNTRQEGFKEIITEFYVSKVFENKDQKCSLLDITLHTGRTHQIRGYFSHINCPIVNDSKYGEGQLFKDYKGYFLTSTYLGFDIDKKYSEFQYLKDLSFSVEPSWIKYLDQI